MIIFKRLYVSQFLNWCTQSGQYPQSLNSAAVTWSLAKELYSPSGPYFVVPMGLFIGVVPTLLQWLIGKVSSLATYSVIEIIEALL